MLQEKELVAKILQGDPKAFEALVMRYEKLVLYVTSKLIRSEDDVMDVCQEVFIKVHRGIHKFSFNAKLSTWIARIAYLTAINHLRKYQTENQRRINDDELLLEQYHFSEETPEHILIQKDVAAYVHHLIDQLPLPYRTALTLYHLQEFSYAEIQEITGMPEGTIKNYLFRARKLLKEKLEVYLQDEK
ncbi:RNA polymerase sigma-70 factor (ECF subfamily) [Pedobacter metabolipauper]|uniref:RNA polymerase sigma-70 factor (ECF subfamily) n=2 Tax=Pedobacter metabolipauper TaxID=425513 RepID=A0A4R6SX87_9SPHI|nr:RNA polymerase sigma-70 factor (ECF subfamily) [Pedobacter metabolipauper]